MLPSLRFPWLRHRLHRPRRFLFGRFTDTKAATLKNLEFRISDCGFFQLANSKFAIRNPKFLCGLRFFLRAHLVHYNDQIADYRVRDCRQSLSLSVHQEHYL